MTKRALITGGSGQDAWYLSERLLSKGYIVHLQTRSERIAERREGVDWKLGDLTDSEFLKELISSLQPDEIYNLAAVSRPSTAWDLPFRTAALNAFVPHQMCEYIQKHSPNTRLFQASSSEIFGARTLLPQNEQTPTDPRGPYGIAKDYAHHIVGAYRSQYGLHLSSGILFNHESPRRPLTFVSQKIAYGVAAVSLGLSETCALDERGYPILHNGKLTLGDLNVRRDFGYAGDYVEAMHLMLQAEVPSDYVIGTGEHHSIAEFCQIAFAVIGRDWREHVVTDPSLVRKVDSHFTCSDPAKIRSRLGWSAKTSFKELVTMLVNHQITALTSSARVGS